MPELPEIEAIIGRLAPEVARRRITEVEVLRPAVVKPQSPALFARRVTNRTIASVERRGKNILIPLSEGMTIRVHLRLSGELHTGEPGPYTRAVLRLGARRQLVFDDPRVLGRMNVLTAEELEKALKGLGPEPLSRDFNPGPFLEAAARSKLPVKLFLMEQKHVAGLGNIYAAEALFRAGIDPRKVVSRVPKAGVDALYDAIKTTLRGAIKSARLTYSHPGKHESAAGFVRAVYDREGEPCLRCGGPVRRVQQAGRSTYFCPRCQK